MKVIWVVLGMVFMEIFLKNELGSKIEGIIITLLILRPKHVAKVWSRKIRTMLIWAGE